MALRRLFVLHALITFAAGVVLLAAPETIPKTIDLSIDRSAYLLCYFLGTAELALAFLSFYSRTLADVKSLRLICLTFIVFHAATAAVELYAIMQGVSVKLWANIALRLVVAFLFWRYGLRQAKTPDKSVS